MSKIKTLIFDLDGVLVDTKNIHFDSLNFALKKIVKKQITFKDHLNIFDGLPTLKKLTILNKKKIFDKKYNSKIIKIKNEKTEDLLKKNIRFNKKIYEAFSILSKKYNICIATNAVKKTLDICIDKLRIKKFLSSSLSNEDVKNNKPHPEIYLQMLINTDSKPSEAIIF